MGSSDTDSPGFTIQLCNLGAGWVTLGKLRDCPQSIPWDRDLSQVVYWKGDPQKHDGKWGNESKNGRQLTSSMSLGRSLLWATGWTSGSGRQCRTRLRGTEPGRRTLSPWPSADLEALSPGHSDCCTPLHSLGELAAGCPHLVRNAQCLGAVNGAWPLWTSVPPLKTEDNSTHFAGILWKLAITC